MVEKAWQTMVNQPMDKAVEERFRVSAASELSRNSLPITPLAIELASPPDPWVACQKLSPQPGLLFFDSAGGPRPLAHYSYLMADPFAWLTFRNGNTEWTWNLKESWNPRIAGFPHPSRPISFLENILGSFPQRSIPGIPPFQGGAAGLFGYELSHQFERLPLRRPNEFDLPDLAIGFYDWVLAWDHWQQRAWIIASGIPKPPDDRLEAAHLRIQQVQNWLKAPGTQAKIHPANERKREPAFQKPVIGLKGISSSFSRREYLEAIDRVVAYIRAGDCFQTNLSQRLLAPFQLPPLEQYGRLRDENSAPFSAYFDLGESVILSASPERFLKVCSDGHVETRPIKGTRPRGCNSEEDQRQIQALIASEKDRAENVMIIDLLRNDLGRVCRFGSVQVPQICQLETYPSVHHLVSEVRGRLRPSLGLVDLIKAAFPGGSVTGAPKIRAMEIIAELEPTMRGPYCGSLGWLGFDGAMDSNILIRTMTGSGGWLQFPVGGGIVADSVPETELEETFHKARGLLRSLPGP